MRGCVAVCRSRRLSVHRLIRLYPLFLAGLVFGAARRFGCAMLDRGDSASVAELLKTSLFEVLMLPASLGPNLFVLNGPCWSLFFEMAVSLLYAGLLFRMGTRMLTVVAAGFGLLLVFAAFQNGSLEMGLKWHWFHGGMARTGFSFTLGMLIARGLDRPPRISWLALLPAGALLAILLVQAPFGPLFDLSIVMVVAPVLVWTAARFDPPALLQPAARWLGELSYPVYAIHYPLMFLWLFFAKRAHVPVLLQLIAYVVLVGVLAGLLNRYWDQPMRRRLNAWLAGERRGAIGAPALHE